MEQKSRILYLRSTSMSGAGTRILVHWLNWLDTNGYGIFIAAPNRGWLKEKLSKFRNKKVLDAEFFIPEVKNYPKFLVIVLRLSIFVIKNKIDLIHCNSDVAYFTACTVARITRRPVVTHLHFHYDKRFYSWLFGSWRAPDLVILVSEAFLREEVSKIHAVVPGTPVKALHNCIDFAEYPPVCLESLWESQYVFYPAAIAERKRQLQLYEIDYKLRELGCKFNFIAAGTPKEPKYWELCKQEALNNPGNNVEFVGHVNDVGARYRESLMSLTLSEYETFGYSVLESMASGIPIVGYRVDAVVEVLGEGVHLAKIDDIDAVVDSIYRLRSNFDEWKTYSERIRKRAGDYFSPEYLCPKLIEMYDDVLQSRQGGGL